MPRARRLGNGTAFTLLAIDVVPFRRHHSLDLSGRRGVRSRLDRPVEPSPAALSSGAASAAGPGSRSPPRPLADADPVPVQCDRVEWPNLRQIPQPGTWGWACIDSTFTSSICNCTIERLAFILAQINDRQLGLRRCGTSHRLVVQRFDDDPRTRPPPPAGVASCRPSQFPLRRPRVRGQGHHHLSPGGPAAGSARGDRSRLPPRRRKRPYEVRLAGRCDASDRRPASFRRLCPSTPRSAAASALDEVPSPPPGEPMTPNQHGGCAPPLKAPL